MSGLNELLIEKTAELLKEKIYVAIYQKTGIKPDNIYIYIKQKDNINSEIEIEIEKVEIGMSENIGENTLEEIQLYLKGLLNCDIVIIDATNAKNAAEEKRDEQ